MPSGGFGADSPARNPRTCFLGVGASLREGLPEHGDRLAQRDEITALPALGLDHRVGRLGLGLGELPTEALVLGLQLHDLADALEVQTAGGELGDSAQRLDVVVAVATVAALRARRANQTAALVDAQGLRMHAGQLGRNRDDIHGLGPAAQDHAVSFAVTVAASASCSMAARSASVSEVGTTTSTVTMRSPVPLVVAIPRPFTRWRLPGWVPGRSRSLTSEPSSVGTAMSAPSAAWANVTGTRTVRLLPDRPNRGWRVTWMSTSRSPAGAGFALAAPPCRQLGLRVVGTDRRRPDEHRRAVGLVGLDERGVGADRGHRRLHLLALDDHRLEVAAEAAPLEPGDAPAGHGQGVELAEVGRTLDRRAGEAERRRRLLVVHAGVAVVGLVVEHLRRGPPAAR